MNPQFWSGRRVLVTGHTGFKGSWLVLWLRELGAHVTGFSLPPPTQPSLFEVATVGDGINSILGDVRDHAAVCRIMAESAPEVVFHLAAQSLVRHSYAEPIETYATNVMGTAHILDAVRKASAVRAVVNVTSDKCYENREWPWGYRENEALGGFDPYSSSKGCAELVTAAFRNSFFADGAYPVHRVAIASARAGNVIGGGDWAQDRLIPDILKAVAGGEVVRIRSPHAIRPWQHVLEPLSGYLLLAERLHEGGPDYAEAWNFGPADDDNRTVEWVVDNLLRHWDGARWTVDEGPRPHEAAYLKLDASKARARLGWHPRWALKEALGRTAAWHRAWVGGEDMHAACLTDIRNYVATGVGQPEACTLEDRGRVAGRG